MMIMMLMLLKMNTVPMRLSGDDVDGTDDGLSLIHI